MVLQAITLAMDWGPAFGNEAHVIALSCPARTVQPTQSLVDEVVSQHVPCIMLCVSGGWIHLRKVGCVCCGCHPPIRNQPHHGTPACL